MKLKEYVNNLQKLLDRYGELDVVYSKDDEGNAFNLVHYEPTLGLYEDREFQTEEIDEKNYNAICIN